MVSSDITRLHLVTLESSVMVCMRVHAARIVPSTERQRKLCVGALVNCAVGELVETQDSSVDSRCKQPVVWIRGGVSHHPARLEWDDAAQCLSIVVPEPSVRRIPPSLPNAMTLLANDMAAAVHIGRMVLAQQLTTIAVVVASGDSLLARLIEMYLQQVSDARQNHCVQVVVLNDDHDVEDHAKESLASLDRSSTTEPLLLDGCIDLCGTEASLDFATRQLEPLGMLIVLASDDTGKPTSTRINMNTVVVNELKVVMVGSFRDQLSDAIEFLTTHVALEELVARTHEE